ncbi:hypothetical protein PCANC_12118 [Puccinia coronata f. sp. avenae]|uniref:DUF6818 domain-containing protein n=1 Tax=Puccinia coronata f. sp. avenae TaxID=200324 RepID=A0A2N5UWT6_9BASI|nr:hypothetical protein PCANC_12118 [Puccinia coronata f. sp. avenae]
MSEHEASQRISTPSQPTRCPARQGTSLHQPTTTNVPRRGGGRAPGSQGYKPPDCKALVSAVRQVLPLGSQEWGRVANIYNNWVVENGQMTREQDPLKAKFKSLVNAKKPTGETVCAPWIQDAKSVEMAICERASHNAVVDRDFID